MVWVPFHVRGICGKQSGTKTGFFYHYQRYHCSVIVLHQCTADMFNLPYEMLTFYGDHKRFVARRHFSGGCLKAGLSNFNSLEGHTVRNNSSVDRNCIYT